MIFLKEIYISNGIHLDLLEETLMVKVIYPKAAKGLDLILIAVENAKKSLEEKFVSLALKDEDIFIELGKYFNKERVSTIEMCDISHISGDSAVEEWLFLPMAILSKINIANLLSKEKISKMI